MFTFNRCLPLLSVNEINQQFRIVDIKNKLIDHFDQR